MRNIVMIMVFVLLAGISEGADPVLEDLEASLSAAETTVDMAAATHAIAKYLDQKLTALEGLIKDELREEVREAFEASAALFRTYRDAEAEVAYLYYGDGSMRGAAAKAVHDQLTRQRIEHLLELSPELKWEDDGAGGWQKSRTF